MNPDQLRETTMDPATRRVLPVHVRAEAFDETLRMFTLLMGKGEASGRRAWMEEKGDSVEAELDGVDAGGERQANVARAQFAEGSPRHQADTLLIEESVGEVLGSQPGAADVDKGVERALRLGQV